jgi:hypothetical protein
MIDSSEVAFGQPAGEQTSQIGQAGESLLFAEMTQTLFESGTRLFSRSAHPNRKPTQQKKLRQMIGRGTHSRSIEKERVKGNLV